MFAARTVSGLLLYRCMSRRRRTGSLSKRAVFFDLSRHCIKQILHLHIGNVVMNLAANFSALFSQCICFKSAIKLCRIRGADGNSHGSNSRLNKDMGPNNRPPWRDYRYAFLHTWNYSASTAWVITENYWILMAYRYFQVFAGRVQSWVFCLYLNFQGNITRITVFRIQCY